jgi:hypothetical protein
MRAAILPGLEPKQFQVAGVNGAYTVDASAEDSFFTKEVVELLMLETAARLIHSMDPDKPDGLGGYSESEFRVLSNLFRNGIDLTGHRPVEEDVASRPLGLRQAAVSGLLKADRFGPSIAPALNKSYEVVFIPRIHPSKFN